MPDWSTDYRPNPPSIFTDHRQLQIRCYCACMFTVTCHALNSGIGALNTCQRTSCPFGTSILIGVDATRVSVSGVPCGSVSVKPDCTPPISSPSTTSWSCDGQYVALTD